MTHEVIRHLLDDYVTGDLAEDARAAVADHVAGCEICRSEVEDLRTILAKAAELPKSIDPPPAAWQNIRASIEREKLAVDQHAKQRANWWQRPSAIAAALLLAAFLSSAGTALYMRTRVPPRVASSAPAGAAMPVAPATLAAFTVEENNYLRNVAVLQDMLDQQEASLAPETVAQLKASLRTIDEAILEARIALARDPANQTLMEMLSGTYRQKVDLLRRTTELTRGT
jgi:anti-sigma factor RsiW